MYNIDCFPESLRNKPDTALSQMPTIHPTCTIRHCQFGEWTEIGEQGHFSEVIMGDYSYTAGYNEIIYTTIGKFTSIATNVRINPGNHPQWRVTQHHCTYRRKKFGFSDTDESDFFNWRRQHHCHIGHDVWLGHGVTIMPGISIGHGAIIGTGAVVTKDIAPYEIAVGVPAKVIKKRFPDDIIEKLLHTAWWDWDRTTLEEHFEDLNNMDVFLAKHT